MIDSTDSGATADGSDGLEGMLSDLAGTVLTLNMKGMAMVSHLPRCHGCGADVGEMHDEICDVARCQATGLQWAACDHQSLLSVPHQPDIWTGSWPGEEDCKRLGWFARLEPGNGWVRCSKDDAGAEPDINRLYAEAIWEPGTQRWEPK